jgi:hypothetical protein
MRRSILLMALFVIWVAGSLFGISYAGSNKDDYELQERCGKRAAECLKEWYGSEGLQSDEYFSYLRSYTNHCNIKLNKCFILVQELAFSRDPEARKKFGIRDDKSLWDVNENKIYGEFIIYRLDHMPDRCEVLGKRCISEEEWDSLVKPYIEE